MDPLFDNVAHTQAGMPHLLELLLAEYKDFLTATIEKKSGKAPTPEELEVIIQKAPASSFIRFGVAYLKQHRPVESFHVDLNYGIKLSNNKSCVLCPGTNIQGTMQNSGAVAVTRGLSQPGSEGVLPAREIGI